LFGMAERKPRDSVGDISGDPHEIAFGVGVIPSGMSLENVTRCRRNGAGIP